MFTLIEKLNNVLLFKLAIFKFNQRREFIYVKIRDTTYQLISEQFPVGHEDCYFDSMCIMVGLIHHNL
jgi:hypothetical protein